MEELLYELINYKHQIVYIVTDAPLGKVGVIHGIYLNRKKAEEKLEEVNRDFLKWYNMSYIIIEMDIN